MKWRVFLAIWGCGASAGGALAYQDWLLLAANIALLVYMAPCIAAIRVSWE